MKASEYREMTLDEVKLRHEEMIDELVNLRIKLALRQLENPLQVRNLKRDIARARTILREKESGAMPGQKRASNS